MNGKTYDVVIVGAGISGCLVAREMGRAGRSVLILESGQDLPPTNRESYLANFYLATAKTPESPYPPLLGQDPANAATPRATVADGFAANVAPDFPGNLERPDGFIYDPAKSYLLQKGPFPFASTYERIAGGTTWHWLGTSLRFLQHDFTMRSTYGVMRDWPAGVFDELVATYYNRAETEIGVAADRAVQEKDLSAVGLEYSPPTYQYPMQAIPTSLVDDTLAGAVDGTSDFVDFEGLEIQVTSTPAGRNSQPVGQRRTCAGNTNCIPICPIQAKYDATVTLAQARQTGNVELVAQAVATRVRVDAGGLVSGIDYVTWKDDGTGVEKTGGGTAIGKVYVIAAHAIETPKLLLMSRTGDQGGLAAGVANSSGLVGANLMDHPLYLSWSLMPKQVWGYRGPLTTAGIETLRDGAFRNERAAWRVEVGNEGWNFAIGDPWTTTNDFIAGGNVSQTNPDQSTLFGDQLVARLNQLFSRQWRIGFLVEQTPDPGNRILLSTDLPGGERFTDGLGLPRPVIRYDLSEYTKLGFVYAEIFARQVYRKLGARCYTQNPRTQTVTDLAGNPIRTVQNPTWFPLDPAWRHVFEALPDELKTPEVTNLPASSNGVPEGFQYFGSGHLVGTTVMGSSAADSVVDADQRTWDHRNLFLLGSGVFPTVTTANPTLTLAALALKASVAIGKELAAG